MAMAKNAVLKRKAKRAMRQARQLSRHIGATEHVCQEANYAAERGRTNAASSIKAEVVRADGKEPKDNPAWSSPTSSRAHSGSTKRSSCQRGEIVAPASHGHRLCAGSDLDTARTFVETRCPCARLGAARDGAPTRVLSVSSHIPASGTGTTERRPDSIGLDVPHKLLFSHPHATAYREKLCPRIAAAPTLQAHEVHQHLTKQRSLRRSSSSTQPRRFKNHFKRLHE